MRNEAWEAVSSVFEKLDALVIPSAGGDGPSDELQAPAKPPMVTLVDVRAKVRAELDKLRLVLQDSFTEREAYLVLFPIVVHLDEYVQTKLMDARQSDKAAYFSRLMKWPSLQKELFDTEDGGVIFYETLDELLRKPTTPVFVYQVFLLCLKHGFQGRYNDSKAKRDEYINVLAEKINDKEPVTIADDSRKADLLPERPSYAWCYLAGLAFLVVFYGLLGKMAAACSTPTGSAAFVAPAPVSASRDNTRPAGINKGEKSSPASLHPGLYAVQAGPLMTEERAEVQARRLRNKGFMVKTVPGPREDGTRMFSVRVGPSLPFDQASALLDSFSTAEGIRCELKRVEN